MIFASYLIRLILDTEKIIPYYLFNFTKTKMYWNQVETNSTTVTQPNLNAEKIKEFQIPLPPKDIQEKIVAEIELLEKQEQMAVEEVEKLKDEIFYLYKNTNGNQKRLDEICELKAGQFVKAENIFNTFSDKLFPCYGGNGLRGFTETFTNNGQFSLVGRQGALCGNVHLVSGKFHATEHALVVNPKENVIKTWLHYQLLFMNLNQYATGTAQPGLSVMNLNPIEISVPTLEEQNMIVSEIEKIENKIADLKLQIGSIPKQKELILKKYL
jgi:restriction endonuclease S subunit